MKCPVCSTAVEKGASYCENCGSAGLVTTEYTKESVMKNPFGLLGLLLFLSNTLMFFVILPRVLKVLNSSTKMLTMGCIIGYCLVILLGIISYLCHRKSKYKELTEKSCKTGITVALFSMLLIIVQVINR